MFYRMYLYLPPALLRGVSSHHFYSFYTPMSARVSMKADTLLTLPDDSVIVSLLNDQDTDHGPVVRDFIDWCERSSLNINVSKTKEMITDFRKKPRPSSPAFIHGPAVEVVQLQYN